MLIDDLSLNDSVTLIGPRDDIHHIIPLFDFLVLSSISEAFPNVLIEAMSCGVPPITTDVGDCRLIVDDLGFICPPSDSYALSDLFMQASRISSSEYSIYPRDLEV